MACVVWIEGVDLSETIFDTEKLSIIRGGSRAYEEMPPLARATLLRAFPGAKVVAFGGSMAGFVVEADAAAVRSHPEIGKLIETLGARDADGVSTIRPDATKAQGYEPTEIESASEPDAYIENVRRTAPFAHLRLLYSVQPVAAANDLGAAIDRARAAIRVAQLREPGVRLRPARQTGVTSVCALDGKRAAEVMVHVPPLPRDEEQGYSRVPASRASAARWHFGRAMRQRLYHEAELHLRRQDPNCQYLAFVDDFQEMVQRAEADGDKMRPLLPGGRDLPVSVEGKMAVFCADGDRFTGVRKALVDLLGQADGLQTFSLAVMEKLDGLVNGMTIALAKARDAADPDLRAAVSIPIPANGRHNSLRKPFLKDGDRLLRFETLVLGGDDTTFVVPAWLGWWLARWFFKATVDWSITAADIKSHTGRELPPDKAAQSFPLHFSAGMVICDRKTPIRAAKDLAGELMRIAKDSGGGLEVEVLESHEPPAEGINVMRNRLLGDNWCASGKSRLTIPRGDVDAHYQTLAAHWDPDQPLPSSQLYRALRQARAAGDLSGAAARGAALDAVAEGAKRSARLTEFKLDDNTFLPGAEGEAAALRLHFVLQQRHYIVAASPWIKALDDFAQALPGGQP